MQTVVFLTALAVLPLIVLIGFYFTQLIFLLFGQHLRSKTELRRQRIYEQYLQDQKVFEQRQSILRGGEQNEQNKNAHEQDTWSGVIGFFHPFCNAGGGGERVLWAAIAATQKKYPRALCAVYTGDHGIERRSMVRKVKQQFEISLHEPSLHFVYLSTRDWVLPSTWPHFTLLGQSLGSLILAQDAFSLLVPDMFIDTMGYAFAVAYCRYLFPNIPTAAYVHYPTISTDMLKSLDDKTGTKGVNAGQGSGWRGRIKKLYWEIFALAYGWVGRRIDIVMCNSSWTSGHITQLWNRRNKFSKATTLYPPCPVAQVARQIDISAEAEDKRENIFLYIAQFRPEKNHFLVLNAFSKFFQSTPKTENPPRLVLIGSVRANTPDEKHIYKLRLEARTLRINDNTTFITDAPFDTIMQYLKRSNVGINGMYSEHFGIGNVEGQAAGLILVCHNSGGPKMDICVPLDGKPTGFLAENEDDYAAAFRRITAMGKEEKVAMRRRARESANRFTDEIFAEKWIVEMDRLMALWKKRNPARSR